MVFAPPGTWVEPVHTDMRLNLNYMALWMESCGQCHVSQMKPSKIELCFGLNTMLSLFNCPLESQKNFSVTKASKKHLLQREQEIFLPVRALGAF